MLLLAIETSSARGALALFRGQELIAEAPFPEGLLHGREIAVHLEAMMRRLGLLPGDLQAVAVGIGPGSYTGLRVGVTSAKTLAFALRIPVIALSSLEVMAANLLRPLLFQPLPGDPVPSAGAGSHGRGVQVVPAMDGKQHHVYLARFRVERAPAGHPRPAGETLGGAVVREVEDGVLAFPGRSGAGAGGPLLEELARVLSPGAMVVGDAADLVIETAAGSGAVRGPREHDWPLASVLGSLAARSAALDPPRYDPEAVHLLTPLYLRGSSAELKLSQKS